MATRALGIILLTLGLIFTGLSAASADPVIQPGCASASHTSKWGNSTYPTYSYRLSLRWCWTGGAATNVHIYNVSGAGYSSATTIFQTQNATGPTDRNIVPINSGTRFGPSVTVYGFFQSRDCVTGNFNWICSNWTWHRMNVALSHSPYATFYQAS